ncbi:hypothetical protein K2173_018826 [Erythroxylum novogranatense]|uniref:Transposase MuDR plant domain-containing protein n=1 Tax=Erythroxylum novogranatense TaxID=1862640 RepID=A0AAV8SBE2_9ROSI|nr:hypothetical protein K2173_018826 [Erythroxylum novogranatense]
MRKEINVYVTHIVNIPSFVLEVLLTLGGEDGDGEGDEESFGAIKGEEESCEEESSGATGGQDKSSVATKGANTEAITLGVDAQVDEEEEEEDEDGFKHVEIPDDHEPIEIESTDFGSFIGSDQYPSREEFGEALRRPSSIIRHNPSDVEPNWRLGMEFDSAKDFRESIENYAVWIGYNVKFKKSERHRMRVRCIERYYGSCMSFVTRMKGVLKW